MPCPYNPYNNRHLFIIAYLLVNRELSYQPGYCKSRDVACNLCTIHTLLSHNFYTYLTSDYLYDKFGIAKVVREAWGYAGHRAFVDALDLLPRIQ